MSWPKNKTRVVDPIDCRDFIFNLSHEFPLRRIAKAAKVDESTIRRWRDGTRKCSLVKLNMIIDNLWPTNQWSKQPRLSGDGDIGPATWVVGVGDYTRRSACYKH